MSAALPSLRRRSRHQTIERRENLKFGNKKEKIMSTIAWIGLGHMGQPMSQHMRKAGYVVRGVDIDPAAAKRARRDGIEVVDTVAEACKGVDAVFTMLPAGPDVKKVLTGPGGVFASVPAKAVVVDCSTIGIEYALEIHKAADQAGRAFVEAPVSGGTEGAVAGTLTFMLGGEEKYKDRVTTLLEPMGSFISYVGGAGAGQTAKVVNNLVEELIVWVSSNKLMSSEEYYASEFSDDYLDAQADAGDYFLDESGFYFLLNSAEVSELVQEGEILLVRDKLLGKDYGQ
jgi:6-phosphogluconate dehydrogenase (decarboxylating)